MGVAGAGKTTVGQALAASLGWSYLDADDFHSAANVEKMRVGIPLTDTDRGPWLDAIADRIGQLEREGVSAVIGCSALRHDYRKRLRAGASDVRFVYLRATRELIRQRLEARTGHFMPPTLLDSQFQTLEEPRDALFVDASDPPDALVRQIRKAL